MSPARTTTSKQTPRQAALALGDELLNLWADESQQPPTEPVDTHAVRAAAQHLHDALVAAGVPAEAVLDIARAVALGVDRHDRDWSASVEPQAYGPLPDVSRRNARASFHQAWLDVRVAVDRALVDFEHDDDLTAAAAAVDDLEDELQDAVERLEAAVTAADVPRVMTLRGDVEVGLPVGLAKARLRLLDLRAQRAAASAPAAVLRADDLAVVEQEAQQRLEAAEEAANAARLAMNGASTLRERARELAAAAGSDASRLRAEHDALAALTEQDAQRRMRHLAGLPDLQEQPA